MTAANTYQVDILFPGFSGRLENCSLGWGTCALIRGNGHNILLDTGNFGLRYYMDANLAALGVSRGEIDTVLLTHSHFDHCGNISFFPDARFVLTEEEWEYGSHMQDQDLYIPGREWDALREMKKRFIRCDGEEILPGITGLLTPGHTPGSVSYVIHQNEQERWVLAGDAAKSRVELLTKEPSMSLDRDVSIHSIRKILCVGQRFLPGHDGWVKREGTELKAEGNACKTIVAAPGITVNGGQKQTSVYMD